MNAKLEVDSYPLQWPLGWPRTKPSQRCSARYQVSLAQARDELLHSLQLLGVRRHHVVISTDIPTRLDGLPYANARQPQDPGVAVYWLRHREQRVIACDHWLTVKDNMRAIGLSLEYLRGLERAGATEILDRAFSGFTALPAQAGMSSWRAELGFGPNVEVGPAMVEHAYRKRALEVHPDRGGSHEAMSRLNAAREAALKELG